MPKQIARYAVQFGLAGCYLPDSQSGPYEFATRHDLASFIRDQIEFYEFPQATIREANIIRLWGFIKRHGSSSAHFTLHHKHNAISFVGLTEEEYNEMESEHA